MDGAVAQIQHKFEVEHRQLWWQSYLNRTAKFPSLADFSKQIKNKREVVKPDEGLAAWAAHQRALNKEVSK